MGCSLDVYRAYVRSASSANDDSLIGVTEKPVVGDAAGRQYELAVAKGEDDKTQNAAAQIYASLGVGEDGEGVSFEDLQKKLEDVSAYRLSQLAGGATPERSTWRT